MRKEKKGWTMVDLWSKQFWIFVAIVVSRGTRIVFYRHKKCLFSLLCWDKTRTPDRLSLSLNNLSTQYNHLFLFFAFFVGVRTKYLLSRIIFGDHLKKKKKKKKRILSILRFTENALIETSGLYIKSLLFQALTLISFSV